MENSAGLLCGRAHFNRIPYEDVPRLGDIPIRDPVENVPLALFGDLGDT